MTVSLYCLALFYIATEERLRSFSPFQKFLCIKAVIFFSYWQACLFTILLNYNFFSDLGSVIELQNVIISFEIVAAAAAQALAFTYKQYEHDSIETQ